MKCILLLLFSALLFSSSSAQDFSNKGKDFWIGYGYHVRMVNNTPYPSTNCTGANNQTCPEQMQLYITSDVSTTGSVNIPGINFSQAFSVTANQITTIVIPRGAALPDQGLFDKGIHVTAVKPVVVYSFIYVNAISGATVCLPTNTLGKEYYSVNYKQLSNEQNSYSYFFVVATDTGTTRVEITPSATLKDGKPAGVTFSVDLTQGQIYQALGQVTGTSGADLTGSIIRSVGTGTGGCKKIGVYCGSGKISIGCNDPNVGSSDNLYQQIYPLAAWGKSYITIPSTNTGSNFQTNFYRIIRPDASATVTLNGTVIPSTSFTNNFYYQFSGAITNVINSDKPILVVQYFTTSGGGTTNCGNSGLGDPEMIYLNPLEQTISNVTLNSMQPSANTNLSTHFINAVLKNVPGAINSFKIDGISYAANFLPVLQDPNYAYARIKVASQGHTITCDSGFNAIAYGFGGAESYGYSAGTNLKDLYQYITIKNQFATVDFPATCRNSPFQFSITLPYRATSLTWDFNNNPDLLPNAIVTNNNPSPDDSLIVNGKQLYIYKLSGMYTFKTIGTYPVKVIANNPTTDGCSGIQEIDYDVAVFDPPVADWKFVHNGCLSDSVLFFDSTNGKGRAVIKWAWDFGDNTIDSIKNPVKRYVNPGTYPVKLQAITDIGCITDTIKPITIDKLDAKFSISTPQCENKAVTFADLSAVSATGTIIKWYWDYGDGKKDTLTLKSNPTHIYSVGTYTAKLTVESNTGCRNTYTLPVKINPDPKVNFILPQVCLNDAFAQFSDSSFISDGSEGSFSYQWNFGDPASGALNTATSKNPNHKYNSVGVYNVSLTITSNNGCVASVTKPFTVNGAVPKANFSILNNAELCSNTNVQIQNTSTVDFGNITKVEIFWDAANNPSVIDTDNNPAPNKIYTYQYQNFQTPLTKTYQVTFRSYSGSICVDEITKPITINASPSVQFLPISDTCFNIDPFKLTQASETGGVPGTGVYSGKGITNGSNIFNPAVAGVGTHAIRYTFTSNTGCVDYKEQTITIYPIVNVNAGPDRTVLEDASITLEPIISGNVLQYLWTPNQYLNNDTIRNPVVSGAQDITYTLNVTGTGGCVFSDQVFVKVLKFPNIPNTFTPNGDGINETWIIQNLADYPNVRVQVFNRYGQLVFESKGYTKPWDGSMNGKWLPFGTYYYVIEPGNGRKPVTGYVTIIK